MPWTVTRQMQWPDGNLVVEISAGGLDYANPDALAKVYPGELETYNDPVKAVEVAIRIAMAWKKDRKIKRGCIGIAHGSTGGMTMPFEGKSLSAKVFRELHAWAKEQRDLLPKCDFCGKPIFTAPYQHYGDPDQSYCSEFCADEALAANTLPNESEDCDE